MKDVVVVGFDGTFNAMDSIEKGEMSGSVAQQPIEEGYQGVVNAVKILKGESVEKQQPLTFNAMDSIEKGEMSGSVAQQPIEEGYQGVVNAVKILKGESVEKQQPLDVVVLSKDNVADFRAEVEAKIEESGVKLG